MNARPIGLGVIGMGLSNMASTLTLLRDEPDLRYRMTAICGLPEEVIERCAREFQVPFWTTDYRALVARDDVDVVAVFSPDALHAEHCAAALEAGKHVVCTKPMVTRLEDAQRLVSLVRQTGLKFLVGQTMRFDRQFLHARQLFERGELGQRPATVARRGGRRPVGGGRCGGVGLDPEWRGRRGVQRIRKCVGPQRVSWLPAGQESGSTACPVSEPSTHVADGGFLW